MKKLISIVALSSLLFVWIAVDLIHAKEIIWKKDGAKMVLIPSGTFEMGDHMGNMINATPVHRVELSAFYMDIYEVTVGQFKQFVQDSGYNYNRWKDIIKYSPTDDHPIVFVTWYDAMAYSQWAGKRLPTEAEWEYAARGNLEGKLYPWGDNVSHDDANYLNPDSKHKWYKQAAPVGSFAANGFGLLDVAGNVWEWCLDWYGDYPSGSASDPVGPSVYRPEKSAGLISSLISFVGLSVGPTRVNRGGSWLDWNGRSAGRGRDAPDLQHSYVGFRLSLQAE